MKVSVDIDCTPEEVRRFMGLPDLSSVHEAYLDRIRHMISDAVTPDGIETLIKSWSPMGEAGTAMWRQIIEQMSGAATKK